MKNLLPFTLVVVTVCLTTTTTSAVPHHHHHHHFPNKRQAEYVSSLASYDVVTPVRVGGDGRLLTHDLSHAHDNTPAARRKRHTLLDPYEEHDLHYLLPLDGTHHQVTLRPSSKFLAPHAVVERMRRRGSGVSSSLQVVGGHRSCHYIGFVANHTVSRVALSTCDGLSGYVRTDKEEYLIEPVKDHPRLALDSPHPHLVYRRSALPAPHHHTCATQDTYEKAIQSRVEWEEAKREVERKNRRRRSVEEGRKKWKRRKRSVSLERNVEVTVVADKKMVDYYDNEDITTYILTVMNMVSSVYHDASIGNAVNIYVVRIILLEDPQYEEELDISHNADDTLRSFCNWQQMVNPGNETHPYHHDVAVLITRYNICSQVTDRCSTLGVSEIAGMCQPLRSCNVNEDTGLQIAYTIAHELGHNFGMNHDGPQNGCDVQFGSQHVMSPHLTNDAAPLTWSNCSRQEITKFLDREWGSCLEDEPPEVEYSFPELPPGAMYDADHQCRLSFGPEATHCDGIEEVERVCQTLWCHLNHRCITRMEPAAEGTQCGKHKWCSAGECVTMGERPAAIHGSWGAWSQWSPCTRTCGAGVATAHRHCDNPAPANGGRYCTGDRKKYRICNTQECPENGVSFRAVQCAEHNNQPYKGETPNWLPVMFDHSPCQLDCKPDNEFFSVKLRDSVVDGTPCRPGTRDMCIHGVCKRVACDLTIEGTAQEDRCGLCHGDGTQCVTSRGEFNVTRGSGYVPVFTFPKEARNVKVVELQDAANYLAVMDNTTGQYYLNGNWIIRWSGEYSAKETMMYYSREGETEELFLPGPLKRPLTLMLLFQTDNPGLKWEYTLPHENATYTPSFSWEHSDWSICTVTCGGGTQVSRVQCVEQEAGLVEEQYCSNQTRPQDLSRTCNNHVCPAWWWSGPWQPCSITCGAYGTRRRTVICVRSFGPSEQMALLDSACDNNAKPHETEACPVLPPCPHPLDWSVGLWTRTCNSDPCEYEEREVLCVMPGGGCDPLSRPPDRRQCGNITCGVWEVDTWSQCSADCGEGVQFRRVSCVGGLACRERDEPRSIQECVVDCVAEEETVLELDDLLLGEPNVTTTSTTAATTTTSTTTTAATTTTPTFTTAATTTASTTITPVTTTATTVTIDTATTTTFATTVAPLLPTTTVTTANASVVPTASTEVPSAGTETSHKAINTTDISFSTEAPDTVTSTEVNPVSSAIPITPTTTESITTTGTSPSITTTTNPSAQISSSVAPSSIPTTKPDPATTPLTTSPPSDITTSTQATNLDTSSSTQVSTSTTTSSTTSPPTINSPTASTVETMDTKTLPTPSESTSVTSTTIPEELSIVGSETSTAVSPATTTEPYDQHIFDTTMGTTLDWLTPTLLTIDSSDVTVAKESEAADEKAEILNSTNTPAEDQGTEDQSGVDESTMEATTEGAIDILDSSGEEADENLSAKNRTTPDTPVSKSLLVPHYPDTGNDIDVSSPTNKEGKPKKVVVSTKSLENDQEVSSSAMPKEEEKNTKKMVSPEMGESVNSEKSDKRTDTEATELEIDAPEETSEVEDSAKSKEPTWLEKLFAGEKSEEEKEEKSADTKVLPDLESPTEERPEGVVVDKIDVEGYQVIEVVELPPKGKKKKQRKKVLLHTGAEAVDVVSQLAEMQEEKRLATPEPTSQYTLDYQWNVTQWSQCSAECGGGEQERSAQCVEQITEVPVLPNLCPQPRPHTLQQCNMEECGEWEAGEWGECSAECGVGERQRVVECPSGVRCPSSSRPPKVEPCNTEPCVQWVEGPWSLCTKPCGGGYQIRHVKCVDVRTEEPARTCPKETKPSHKMSCHNHHCPKNRRGEGRRGETRRGQQKQCRDRLDTKLCRRLKHMCSTKFFRVKCCRTCLRKAG